MSQVPTAARLARDAVDLLQASGDVRTAERSRAYFKPGEDVSFHGVPTPRVREIERELYRQVRDRWTLTEAFRFADRMVRDRRLESKALGLLLAGRFRKDFTPDVLERARGWLLEGWCANWAVTDTLCGCVLSPLLEKLPALSGEMLFWTGSGSLWLRRAAAVSLVPMARRGQQLERAYEIAQRLLGDREDLVHKATGWLLREAGRTDRPRLEAFLLRCGPAVPRTALRYAIEHFPEKDRKRILEATR